MALHSLQGREFEMTLQMLLNMETATAVGQLPRDQTPEHREKEAPGDIAAILVDAAVQVGALIDAVCCRVGAWVDLEHYHPHPRMSVGSQGDRATVVRLTLMEDERSLRAGGYIEVRAMPEENVVEADGGYYDAYHQPKTVIDGVLRWHELNPQRLAQVLILMHNRIMREYWVHERSDESLEVALSESGPKHRWGEIVR
jgi:hypothetical protein